MFRTSHSFWFKKIRIGFIIILSLEITSCSGYIKNRVNDVKDIVTLAFGLGVGFGAHAGPINTGLGYIEDHYDLRSSSIGKNTPGHFSSGYNAHFIFLGEESGWENPDALSRAKQYKARCYIVSFPEFESGDRGRPTIHPYFTQFEVSIGLIGSFRLGINPGEFVDFVLGFFNLDLFKDDVVKNESRTDLTTTKCVVRGHLSGKHARLTRY